MKEFQEIISKSNVQRMENKMSQSLKGFRITSSYKTNEPKHSLKQRKKCFNIALKKKKNSALKISQGKKSGTLSQENINIVKGQDGGNKSFKHLKILNKGKFGEKMSIASSLRHHKSRNLEDNFPRKVINFTSSKKIKSNLMRSKKPKTTSVPSIMNLKKRRRIVLVSKTPPLDRKKKFRVHYLPFKCGDKEEFNDIDINSDEAFTLDQYCDMMDEKNQSVKR